MPANGEPLPVFRLRKAHEGWLPSELPSEARIRHPVIYRVKEGGRSLLACAGCANRRRALDFSEWESGEAIYCEVCGRDIAQREDV